MKKILLIIGIALILILSGLWVYLLFFNGDEDNDGRFSLFGFGDTTDATVSLDDFFQNDAALVEEIVPFEPLRQLTTDPVVGYREIQLATSSRPLVYYVEAGTGHIFSIDIDSGAETRISNITVPAIKEAILSADGRYAALLSGRNLLTIIELPNSATNSALSSFTISEPVISFSFTENNELLYTATVTGGVEAKLFDLINKQTIKTLFAVPFTDVTMSWGNTVSGPHFYYPKPSSNFLGYLYMVRDGVTSRTPISGFGLRAVHTGESVLYTTTDDDNLLSLYDSQTGDIIPLYLRSIPEKCAGDRGSLSFVCGLFDNEEDFRIEDWYTGKMNITGNLRVIDAEAIEILPVLNIMNSGRVIDITAPVWDGESLLFTNKNDKTLWRYND